jgi:carnitine O-acetyltransferase
MMSFNPGSLSSLSVRFCPITTYTFPSLGARNTELPDSETGGMSPERTLAFENSLPRFPVPPLKQTIEKYLTYLQPLVPARDYQFAKNLIDKFMLPGGEGEHLQDLLLQRAKNHENWLSDWWLHCAYLNIREPVVVNSNPGIRLANQTFDSTDAWLTYSAKLIRGILDFKYLLDHQRIPVDRIGKVPLAMCQYYSLFSTCRIPGERRDTVVRYRSDAISHGKPIHHICVAHNNHFYTLNVYHENGVPLSVIELKRALREIKSRSSVKGQPIGLMTAENRNVWGKTYRRLCQNQKNIHSFEQIHKALFLFCLDQPVFGNVEHLHHTERQGHHSMDAISAANMLHGGGHKHNSANRWFDKTIQVIVSRDGACGVNYEHSPAEGPPVVALIDHGLNWMKKWDAENATSNVASLAENDVLDKRPHSRIQELEFTLDGEARDDLDMAKTNMLSLVNDVDLYYLAFTNFGKDKIKNQKLSPDAFFQVALQLAYYRMYGSPCATYESGSIRKFQLGRTDTIRSCSPESVAFTQSMVDEKCSWEKRLSLMVEAVTQHKRYTEAVTDGFGIDRHLLGLKMIAVEKGLDIPKFLVDTSYSKATYYRLSTSQVASKNDLNLCFGPVVPDGYGICYNPQNERITVVISAFNSSPETQVSQLARHLQEALVDMHNLLVGMERPNAPKL